MRRHHIQEITILDLLVPNANELRTKVNTGQSARPIRIVETGVVYRSAFSAAEAVNGVPQSIYRAARGQRKTHRGLHFEYALRKDISEHPLEESLLYKIKRMNGITVHIRYDVLRYSETHITYLTNTLIDDALEEGAELLITKQLTGYDITWTK